MLCLNPELKMFFIMHYLKYQAFSAISTITSAIDMCLSSHFTLEVKRPIPTIPDI